MDSHGGNLTTLGADPEVSFNVRWAEQAFSAAPGAMVQDRLTIVHEDVAGDTKVGRCAAGGPLRLGDRVYARGLGVNSHSVLRVSLTQPAERFLADIGLDRNVDGTAASVRFHVQVAGEDVFLTEVIRPTGRVQSMDVPLNGAREFDLIVDDGGDGRGWDQGDWADARVVLADGSERWLDDLARAWQVGTELPFSFIYGGRPSSEFLGDWPRRVQEETLDATRRRRTLTLTDPRTGLEVRAVATVYTDTPGVDWTLYFTHTGDQETPILEQVQAVDVTIAPGIGQTPVLHRLRGSTAAVEDWLPFDEPLPPGGRLEFASVGGKSSQGVSPFFNLDWGSGGVITALGWSGQWKASLEQAEGGVRLRAGMEQMRLKLHPGETIRSPRILQLYWLGGEERRAYNLFRQTMLDHVVPRVEGKVVVPPIAHLSTSFYELNDSTEANVLSHLESIRSLGFEYFWLDAYYTRDGFPQGMGNYGLPVEEVTPDPARFPRGIKPVSEAVQREGLQFLMWFEPERVHPGTHIAREHPDYVISPGQDGSGLFNLGLPEAREYMTQFLIAAVREYRLGCLRIDYNLNPLPFWQFVNEQDPDRVGMAEIRYVEGLYRMWDDILAACPGLFIDNCASGGMRIDLETCSRSIPLWRTDATIFPLMAGDFNQAALQNQVLTAGLSRYVPFSVSGQMGATPYLFRSGFNAGISFCEDCRPEDYPRGLLRQAIAEGRRIRKYYLGHFYPLSEVTTSARDWCVLQYHRPAEEDGLIVAFRRHRSPYASFVCDLPEIDEQADYEVTQAWTYEPAEPTVIPGHKFRRFKLEIEDCPGSLIAEYRRVREAE